MENYNTNRIGGDINGDVRNLTQLFTRPVAKINLHVIPAKSLYICSTSTPQCGGVHAAKTVLDKEIR